MPKKWKMMTKMSEREQVEKWVSNLSPFIGGKEKVESAPCFLASFGILLFK